MQNKKGKVYLVGAGPGDPELITIKGIKALEAADVVIYDRLLAAELLAHAPALSEKILVGKQRNCKVSTQAEINALIVECALAGKNVVRLKGGDVSVFGNVLDELQALKAHDILYEIIPGVTAASGASAYAGVPLTARQISDEVHLLSFHDSKRFEEIDWKYHASLRGTLALYMSSANLSEVCKRLQDAGMKNLPLMVIEQATTPFQQKHLSSVFDAVIEFANKSFVSPALVLIGEVVLLSEKFDWHSNKAEGKFFKDLLELKND